jgi:hypothetical protein
MGVAKADARRRTKTTADVSRRQKIIQKIFDRKLNGKAKTLKS